MRAVIQRVERASVTVEGETVGRIGRGIVVLLGVGVEDGEKDALWMAGKTANLRIFEDDRGKMNLSLLNVGGEALVVSQFTLYGDARPGAVQASHLPRPRRRQISSTSVLWMS
jgi:D-tyrosyl-tRNA(Tyr) deacylase